MAGGKKMDRRGSGPYWFLMVAFLVYFLYSLVAAATTVRDCGDGPKHWEFIPPHFECDPVRGIG